MLGVLIILPATKVSAEQKMSLLKEEISYIRNLKNNVEEHKRFYQSLGVAKGYYDSAETRGILDQGLHVELSKLYKLAMSEKSNGSISQGKVGKKTKGRSYFEKINNKITAADWATSTHPNYGMAHVVYDCKSSGSCNLSIGDF